MKRNRNQRNQEGVPISAWIMVGVLGVVLAIFRHDPAASANPITEGAVQPSVSDATPRIEMADEAVAADAQRQLQPRAAGASTLKYVQPGEGRTAYLLRVGPYQSGGLAEAFKARIALLGYASSIERFEQEGRMHYRVRLGPFTDQVELDEAKRRLREGGVNSLSVVKR